MKKNQFRALYMYTVAMLDDDLGPNIKSGVEVDRVPYGRIIQRVIMSLCQNFLGVNLQF